ncbi:hypothetical protein EGH22_00170 [Halomicroarcula sp. F28]|uniref:hypothetical protein n=1 Tax=Haloarcula salinisoli TaxID=2487746 RepID=UPI001C733CBC|nr:hypothetical protein [Halomicroarcula salinisoli]MBX0284731.1 hypothetical protein [Halomicroarcula salinisoli]
MDEQSTNNDDSRVDVDNVIHEFAELVAEQLTGYIYQSESGYDPKSTIGVDDSRGSSSYTFSIRSFLDGENKPPTLTRIDPAEREAYDTMQSTVTDELQDMSPIYIEEEGHMTKLVLE